jgi:hypothetical protein
MEDVLQNMMECFTIWWTFTLSVLYNFYWLSYFSILVLVDSAKIYITIRVWADTGRQRRAAELCGCALQYGGAGCLQKAISFHVNRQINLPYDSVLRQFAE